MSFTRKSIADHLDSYDEEISALQDSKRETLDDYRAQLAHKGFRKAQIKAEVEALKRAMRRRRAIAKTSEAEVEQADDLADEIFVEITSPAPRATPARENIEQFPPHNPETGELTDTQEQPGEPANTSALHTSPETGSAGDPSPTCGRKDLVEAGTGQKGAVLPQEPCTAQTTPSPELPQATADGEATPPAKSSAPIPSAADLLPGAVKAPEVGSSRAVLPQSEIPAFLRKSAADYRPNCQHPDACGSSNPTGHCYTCKRAMEAAESEVA